jgi:hypothetical protein
MAMQMVLVIRMTGLATEVIELIEQVLGRIAVVSLRMECKNRLCRCHHRLLVMAISRASRIGRV